MKLPVAIKVDLSSPNMFLVCAEYRALAAHAWSHANCINMADPERRELVRKLARNWGVSARASFNRLANIAALEQRHIDTEISAWEQSR